MRLLVLHTWGIGDWLMFLPSLRLLLRGSSRLQVDLALGREGLEPLIPVDPRVRVVEAFDARSLGLIETARMCSRLRSHGYDLVIFTGTTRSVIAVVSALAGFPRSVALTNPGMWLPRVTALVQRPGEPRFRAHERLLAAAGLTVGDAAEVATVGAVANRSRPPRVILHPGSEPRMPFKRWPIDRWLELARRLSSEGAAEAVFLLGPAEDEQRGAIESSGLGEVIQPISLADLMFLLEASDVLVCADSGVGHVAAHVRIPVVSLYGPAHPDEVRPWSTGLVVTLRAADPPACSPCVIRGSGRGCKEQPCMTRISVAQVAEAVRGVLSNGPAQERKCSVNI